MRAFGLEPRATLLINQPRSSVRKVAVGIVERFAPLSLEEQRPAGTEPLQDIVDARTRGDQLGLGRALEIGSAKRQRALKAAILVEDDTVGDQRRPRQMVGKPVGAVA